MQLVRASELPEHALVDLFNAGYSDYLLPMRLTTAAFAEHVATNDIDLECSRVVRDDQPAALALIAHRDGAGWVGGMATVPGYRRRGLGAEALTAGLAALAERGASVAWLEVINQNRRALALYEKLGFEVIRDLVVWSLPARATDSTTSRTIEPSSARAWICANRQDREPWQRADESVAAIGARGGSLRGLVVDRDGGVAAAALLRDDAAAVKALQVVATDEQAAADLLLAAAGAARELRFRNVPEGAPASLALELLGARRIATQHEMRVTL
ncbi:MAG TPA: GNAT family N-acetyltransferase [Solirubrobacteraceae bacterium]|nr:GNAT family N-acetyltransferase [Solirubrobacteraceae bacterium]